MTQIDASGERVLSWGHILEALCKLDIGSSERIVLVSSDERSLIVASYKDIHQSIEKMYNQLKHQVRSRIARMQSSAPFRNWWIYYY